MTPELDKYYQDRFEMLSTKGWNDLIDDVREMFNATNTLNGIDNESMLHYRKGEVSIMQWLLSLKEVSEESYKGLLDEDG